MNVADNIKKLPYLHKFRDLPAVHVRHVSFIRHVDG